MKIEEETAQKIKEIESTLIELNKHLSSKNEPNLQSELESRIEKFIVKEVNIAHKEITTLFNEMTS